MKVFGRRKKNPSVDEVEEQQQPTQAHQQALASFGILAQVPHLLHLQMRILQVLFTLLPELKQLL